MDFDQQLPPVAPDSKTLRRIQAFDLLGQVGCLLLISYLAYARHTPRFDTLDFEPGAGLVFLLGTWQLLSAFLHVFVWRWLPGRKWSRKLHLIVGSILAGSYAWSAWSAAASMDAEVVVLLALLFLSPFLIALYFCITALDLWKLSGGNGLPVRSGRRVVLQALLLLLLLMPPESLPFAEGGLSGLFYPVGFILVIIALAGWLLAGSLKARRAGQASLLETVCMVWVGLLIVLQIAGVLFKFYLAMPFYWLSLFFSPGLALAVWYTAQLWRGPLARPVAGKGAAVSEGNL